MTLVTERFFCNCFGKNTTVIWRRGRDIDRLNENERYAVYSTLEIMEKLVEMLQQQMEAQDRRHHEQMERLMEGQKGQERAAMKSK